MKQKDIAKLLGVSQGTVSNWLSGKTEPTNLAKQLLKNYPKVYDRIQKRQLRRSEHK